MEIQFKDLSFRYGGKKSPLALKDANARIGEGIHLLLGENGAGKTTLLHIIAGLLSPTSGKCLIDNCPAGHRLPSILSKIFYLGAGMPLPATSIAEMAKIHGCFYPTLSMELLERNLAEFGIDPGQKLSRMSMGTRQKASLAYALALKVPVLLLDEPATGLDIQSKQTLQHMFASSIDSDQTVIVSTHTVADLRNLFDSLLVLHRGQLLLSSYTDDILTKLSFVTTTGTPADDALFSIPAMGMWRNIVACDGVIESDIDYELLYLALMNEHTSPAILKLLERK